MNTTRKNGGDYRDCDTKDVVHSSISALRAFIQPVAENGVMPCERRGKDIQV